MSNWKYKAFKIGVLKLLHYADSKYSRLGHWLGWYRGQCTESGLPFTSFFPHMKLSFLISIASLFLAVFSRFSPGWSGSVGWAWACKPKGGQFNSQPGHMPGFQARSPVGGTWEATTHYCFSPSLSPSLPLSKINKSNFFKNVCPRK